MLDTSCHVIPRGRKRRRSTSSSRSRGKRRTSVGGSLQPEVSEAVQNRSCNVRLCMALCGLFLSLGLSLWLSAHHCSVFISFKRCTCKVPLGVCWRGASEEVSFPSLLIITCWQKCRAAVHHSLHAFQHTCGPLSDWKAGRGTTFAVGLC